MFVDVDEMCPLCGKPVQGAHRPYRQVVGWVKTRDAGGVNSIRDAKPTGKYAHAECVDRAVNAPMEIPGQMAIEIPA